MTEHLGVYGAVAPKLKVNVRETDEMKEIMTVGMLVSIGIATVIAVILRCTLIRITSMSGRLLISILLFALIIILADFLGGCHCLHGFPLYVANLLIVVPVTFVFGGVLTFPVAVGMQAVLVGSLGTGIASIMLKVTEKR